MASGALGCSSSSSSSARSPSLRQSSCGSSPCSTSLDNQDTSPGALTQATQSSFYPLPAFEHTDQPFQFQLEHLYAKGSIEGSSDGSPPTPRNVQGWVSMLPVQTMPSFEFPARMAMFHTSDSASSIVYSSADSSSKLRTACTAHPAAQVEPATMQLHPHLLGLDIQMAWPLCVPIDQGLSHLAVQLSNPVQHTMTSRQQQVGTEAEIPVEAIGSTVHVNLMLDDALLAELQSDATVDGLSGAVPALTTQPADSLAVGCAFAVAQQRHISYQQDGIVKGEPSMMISNLQQEQLFKPWELDKKTSAGQRWHDSSASAASYGNVSEQHRRSIDMVVKAGSGVTTVPGPAVSILFVPGPVSNELHQLFGNLVNNQLEEYDQRKTSSTWEGEAQLVLRQHQLASTRRASNRSRSWPQTNSDISHINRSPSLQSLIPAKPPRKSDSAPTTPRVTAAKRVSLEQQVQQLSQGGSCPPPWCLAGPVSKAASEVWSKHFVPLTRDMAYLIMCVPSVFDSTKQEAGDHSEGLSYRRSSIELLSSDGSAWDQKTYRVVMSRMIALLERHQMWHTLTAVVQHAAKHGVELPPRSASVPNTAFNGMAAGLLRMRKSISWTTLTSLICSSATSSPTGTATPVPGEHGTTMSHTAAAHRFNIARRAAQSLGGSRTASSQSLHAFLDSYYTGNQAPDIAPTAPRTTAYASSTSSTHDNVEPTLGSKLGSSWAGVSVQRVDTYLAQLQTVYSRCTVEVARLRAQNRQRQATARQQATTIQGLPFATQAHLEGLNPNVWYRRMLLEQVGLILLSMVVMLYMYM